MSSKVERITVSNLKAIKDQTATFNGCTAIITGGNNKGKTSFLRSLPDRIHGVKPDVIVKIGESEGYAEWHLTTGEKFIWSFDNGTEKRKTPGEKLTFITANGIKQSVTRELALRYFPPVFNVDEFLNSTPKKQKEMLQKLVGLDFSDVDARYDAAYNEREGKNRKAHEQKIIFEDMQMPEEVKPVSLEQLVFDRDAVRNKLNKTYLANKAANEKARKEWEAEVQRRKESFESLKKEREEYFGKIAGASEALANLVHCGYIGEEVGIWIEGLRDNAPDIPTLELPNEPTYIKEMPDDADLKAVDEKILNAQRINQRAQDWNEWTKQRDKMQAAKVEAEAADVAVKNIEREKMDMIRSAKMPEGFGFAVDKDAITYNNLPFTREQLSSSGIYIAALKLAAMTLGEVRTLHFDASFLDRVSLEAIEKWAASQDMQLLIERPDFNAGDIQYELVCASQVAQEGGKS